MMRTSLLTAALVFALAASASWAQPTTPLLVSGEEVIAILDTDMDGMPDPPQDCSFMAFVNGSLLIESDPGTGVMLQACSGDFFGGITSNGGVGINFTSAPGVTMGVQLPTLVNFHPPADGGHGAGNGNSPTPLVSATIELENGTSEEENASGGLCTTGGGPAVLLTTTDGTTLLFALQFFPSMTNPEFLKAANIPLKDVMGNLVFVDGYIPVTPEKTITVQRNDDPPVFEIPLTELRPCGGPAVPTMSEGGLIVLMMGLLAGGVWLLRRRPAFANSLSVF